MATTPTYKTFFKGKNITMLGLGLLGRGVNVAKFLASLGANLTITDLKDAQALEASLKQLKKFPNITYRLGEHRLEDFRNRDMIIKAAGVPLDSPFIAEAKKHKIPVEMDASLFAKFSPATIIGITGTRGKTTVTSLIYHILEKAYPGHVFLGGNIRGVATLPLLKKAKRGDFVVLELDSWQLQGFGEAKLSPHISVFTNFFNDHMNYYKGNMNAYFKDKAHIFRHQISGNAVVVSVQSKKEIQSHNVPVPGNLILAHPDSVLSTWKIKIPGEHNRGNIAQAIAVCRMLDVSESLIRRGVESFTGVPGRLEFLRAVRGVKYYNDTTATSPEGNEAALKTLAERGKKHIVLIAGGNDKNFDYKKTAAHMHRSVKALILVKGTATEKILALLPKKRAYPLVVVDSMRDAVSYGDAFAEKGDIVLLSPGAASFGVFKNEYDRGDQFTELVKKLK